MRRWSSQSVDKLSTEDLLLTELFLRRQLVTAVECRDRAMELAIKPRLAAVRAERDKRGEQMRLW